MICEIVIVGGLVLISYTIYLNWFKVERTKIITNAHQAHKILKSSIYRRHKSNRWLIDTLFIVNPFTIESESLLKAFKIKVINTLFQWSTQNKYEELVSTIGTCIGHRLVLLQSNTNKLPLSKLVKQVTLDAFLSTILGINVNEDLLTELPDLIIHLWKNRTDTTARRRLQELFSANKNHFSQSEFWQHLQTILSDHMDNILKITKNDFDEKVSNPLNIIVPGWETMWRVVFYSLLELLRRPDLLEELRTQLNNLPNSHPLLLEWVLKETLRLYPPTKNIYRTNVQTDEQVCISVLDIHRNKTVWGADALNFRPERFQRELTDEQKLCYLPFSISCPARHKFAYTFAGALVSQILKHCPKLNITEECLLPTADLTLDITRDSYNDLTITV
ncbi:unnamed protein product [Adineta ricciae]|uniref:Cytochrome P450 n=1 Tax=Adineta ricciae TaxID=249248 RepID=A0A813TTD9_ADIRI|nr:unnamed protein product [Adineta ricciae]CAF0812871.1 unnamed protein product [Adineta ricciae]